MTWTVDTCILIDVLDYDAEYGERSAELLEGKYKEGLIICPISYIELAPAFLGDTSKQNEFLDGVGVHYNTDWTMADTLLAHKAWNRYIEQKRAQQTAKRPIADILIGAFATRHGGILTRNIQDFARLFPALKAVYCRPTKTFDKTASNMVVKKT